MFPTNVGLGSSSPVDRREADGRSTFSCRRPVAPQRSGALLQGRHSRHHTGNPSCSMVPREPFSRRDRRIFLGKMRIDLRIAGICRDRRAVGEIVNILLADNVHFPKAFGRQFGRRYLQGQVALGCRLRCGSIRGIRLWFSARLDRARCCSVRGLILRSPEDFRYVKTLLYSVLAWQRLPK